VTRLRAGINGIRIPVGKRYFYRLQNVHTSSEARLASCSVLTRVPSLQVERPEREALHPPSSIPQLSVVTPQIPPECLCGLYWDNFTFTFGVALTVSLRRRNEEVLVNWAACFAVDGNDNDSTKNDIELVTWWVKEIVDCVAPGFLCHLWLSSYVISKWSPRIEFHPNKLKFA